ncbi:hypothetical protein Syun_009275 [Stephania yunnanensis]|uniref:Uncharacterized protein n=1 Tax=Stephania yunnanensis TaxID=152371 RepID=A0AAP0KE46_9MAGN
MPPTVNELYLHLYTIKHGGVTFIDTRSELFYTKLQRRRQEQTQATSDQPVDDEATYYNAEGECPRGRIYGLGLFGRKKRRYADLGASTSQMPKMVPRSEMTMDGAGLSQPQPPAPPPPPLEQQQPLQTDPVNPPHQQDNVDREMQDCLTRD